MRGERRGKKEGEKERENGDEIVCMRHSTSLDQFSCNVPQSDMALRGILQGPVPYMLSGLSYFQINLLEWYLP